MQIGNTVRSLTQIECGKVPIKRTFQSSTLIRRLVFGTEKRREESIPLYLFSNHLKNPLLHILHIGRFHSDDSRCFQRFGNSDYPHGPLIPGFADVNT
jgi:hypothetical protein